MRAILFGPTGMLGQSVLRECLLDPEVELVLAVVRKAGVIGQQSPKVRELVIEDFYDYTPVESAFAGYDTCFFCLGVSVVGKKEPEYRRLTYDLTTAAAEAVRRANEGNIVFEYVSASGTNSKSWQMWARVKGETEDTLLGMGFRDAYMFRPWLIVPMHGIRSKTGVYQRTYDVLRPLLPLLLRMFPTHIVTTEMIGKSMLRSAKSGYAKKILESADIAIAGRA